MTGPHARLLSRLALAIVLVVPAAAVGQNILFTVSAEAGGLSAPAHAFGCADGGLAGLDARDVPEPPHAPSGYLALAFHMPDPAAPLPNRYRDEVRGLLRLADQVEVWQLHVETDQVGAAALLAIAANGALPAGVHLRLLGAEQDLALPAVVTVPLPAPDTIVWLQLTADWPVGLAGETWSAVKRLYAR